MQQRRNPQQGPKGLGQQQLQRGGSSLDSSGGGRHPRQQRFWPCPVCNRSFALFRLEEHVNQCLDNSPPCPPTSRSSSFTTGGVSCKTSAVELFPATSIQETEDVQCSGTQMPSLAEQQDSLSWLTERGLILKCNVLQPPNENALSPCKVELVPWAGIQRPALTRQQDPDCLSTERCLSAEGNLLHPPNELTVDRGQGGFFAVEDDGGKTQLKRKLEYSISNSRDCGAADLLVKNSWTGDTRDGGLDEQRMAEYSRDGNGLAANRPPAGFKLFQRQVQSQARLSMFRNFSSGSLERKPSVTVLQPGMVLFRSWLDLDTQQKFVQESQAVSHLFHRPTTSGGGKYHVYSMCWGPKWDAAAHRYVAEGPVRAIPSWMFESAQKLAWDAQQHTSVYSVDSGYAPDIGLVNFYPGKADELGVIGLGGHQDLFDSSLMPVVSVSVGDSMTFFYRRFPPFSRRKSGVSISVDEEAARSCKDGDAAHNREHQILLESGDVLVFGGKSRLVYHGTRHVQPGTRPPGLHMVPGRLNFTFRQTTSEAT